MPAAGPTAERFTRHTHNFFDPGGTSLAALRARRERDRHRRRTLTTIHADKEHACAR